MDDTRIVCPLAMRAIDLWHTLLFCGGDVAGSIRHYQREAQRVGWAPEPSSKFDPNRYIPSYCLEGVPPPWRKFGMIEIIPEVIQRVVQRYEEGKYRLAVRILNAEVTLVAREKRLLVRPPNCFQRSTALQHDWFVVWGHLVANLEVSGEDSEEVSEGVKRIRTLAEILTTQKVLDGGSEAAMELAYTIAEAIDIHFGR